MKTRLFLMIGLSLIASLTYGQLFQKQVSIPGSYFHDLNIENLQDNTHDVMVAGSLFDNSFGNPQVCLFRFDDVTGNVIGQTTLNPSSSGMADPRAFDMVRFTENNSEMIALTGSVSVSGKRYLMLVKIDPVSGAFTGGALYQGIVPNLTHSQGLHLIYTEKNNQPGFVVGGFSNNDYQETTNDPHSGFVLRTDLAFNPVWTTEIFTTPANASFDYDMVNHITETDEGFFVTGSLTGVYQNNTRQAVLALKLDVNGNMVWQNCYIHGNSRDVGVDAYYDAVTDEIFLLVNYSFSHYFGITVINENTGGIDFSRTWRAYDWNDLDKYAFTLTESENNPDNLVVSGYDRHASWTDNNGNFVSSEAVPFAYEFEKATGNQVATSYLYHVPHNHPGAFYDYFNFFNAQMPLIFYPDISVGQNTGNIYYYNVAYRTDPASGETLLELIQSDLTHVNACENSEQNFQHQSIQANPVDVFAAPLSPQKTSFSMVQSVHAWEIDSCNRIQEPELDFGDAMEDASAGLNYPTLFASNGARHQIVPSIRMGYLIDAEADGQPSPGADCDDNDCLYAALGDDEDGVSLPSAANAGSTVSFNIIVSVDGFFDAWMDFNLDGDWADAGEHIFASQFVAAGVSTHNFAIPAAAANGQSYLRFRFRDYSASLSYTGLARNGEVEDYMMEIKPGQQGELDFGDAPEDAAVGYVYPTTLAFNGARHAINPDIFLGSLIDQEADGQPAIAADCDDNDCVYPSAGDDEDGVSIPASANAGSVIPITVVASIDGYLDAWMDFNLDGDWADAGEHIFNIFPVAAGSNSLTFTIPSSAGLGQSFVRFRFRDFKAPIGFDGLVENGEVEDYTIVIKEGQSEQIDFGDAPQKEGTTFVYPTTTSMNGAAHYINPDIFLGNRIDGEPDGQPGFGADCDDNDCFYPALGDDEDGVALPVSAVAGTAVTINVTASVDGYLDAWMDFNQNGDWSDAGDHIFAIQPLSSGVNTLNFTIPAAATPGQTYLRFRFRTYNAPITFKGLEQNGEVEDYRMYVEKQPNDNIDFGDSPDKPYPTLLASNGARHIIDGITYLGNLIDPESDGQQSPNSKGDDVLSLDDEDGVQFVNKIRVGKTAKVNVLASVDGYLNTWMDFNKNGSWADAGEHVFNNVPVSAGWNSLSFPVPSTAKKGKTHIRFRFNQEGGLSYDGPADNGEVEDYRVRVCPDWFFTHTNVSHLIGIPKNTFPLNPGDEIGVFYTDNAGVERCAGMLEYTGEENQVLTAFGDDITTPDIKEGFATGEIIKWKICFKLVPVVIDVPVLYDPDLPNHDGTFVPNGLSAIQQILGMEIEAFAEPQEVCAGENVQLSTLVTGGGEDVFYSWTSEPAGFSSTEANPVVTPTENTTYHVEATDGIFTASASVDVMVFPPVSADAGEDLTICGGEAAMLSGAASNYSAVEWTSEGDGEFTDPVSLETSYLPGPEDLQVGTVIITLHALPEEPCTTIATDHISLSVYDAHNLNIPQGWSGISSHLLPADQNIPSLFSPLGDQLTLIYNLSGMYWPAQGINTLQSWSYLSGYILKSTQQAQLDICGNPVIDRTLTLNSNWNIIPVYCETGADVDAVFEGVEGLVVVKEVAGPGVFWPGFGVNTLGTLESGKSYFAYAGNGGEINFAGKCSDGTKASPVPVKSPWNEVAETPLSHVVAITSAATAEMQPGDIIGAFTSSGICAGYTQFTGEATAIALNGSDPYTSEIYGFAENEMFELRLYRPSTGEEMILSPEFDPAFDADGTFNANAMSVLTDLNVSNVGLGNRGLSDHVNIYPNPSTGIITLSGADYDSEITIINTMGKPVYNRTYVSEQIDLRHLPKGLYMITIEKDGLRHTERLILK